MFLEPGLLLEYCLDNPCTFQNAVLTTKAKFQRSQNAKKIAIFYSAGKKLLNLFKKVEKVNQVQYQYEADFVTLERSADFKRFFKHWNKAEKTAFLNNGTSRAQKGK